MWQSAPHNFQHGQLHFSGQDFMYNIQAMKNMPCNPRLGNLCSTLCCATYSPILFGKMESGVYILQKSNFFKQLGGVVAICNPSGGRKVRSWDCLWGHRGRVEGGSRPSPESPTATGRRIGCRGSCRERQRVRRVTEQRLLSAPGCGGSACLFVSWWTSLLASYPCTTFPFY